MGLAVVGGAIGLTCLFFYRAVFTRDVFTARDMLLVYAPVRRYWAERVSRGEFPEWYPFDGLGQSFPGMVLSGVLHPSQLLGWVFSTGDAMKLTVLACFPLALLGTYLLLREARAPRTGAGMGAAIFAFSGYLVCITNNLGYLLAGATLPLTLWAALRFIRAGGPGRAAVAAALLASVLLAGDTWTYAIANAFVLLLAILGDDTTPGSIRARRSVTLVLLGALLAAPQLLAGSAVLAAGAPGASSLEDAQRWSLDPWRLLELGLGPFLANPAQERGVPEEFVKGLLRTGGFSSLWVDSVFLGVPALVLALTGLRSLPRRAWPFIAAGFALLLLAMGSALPFYRLLYTALPLWRPFRYPEKLMVHVSLGVALLAGLGWKAVVESPARARRAMWTSSVLAVLCALMAGAEQWAGAWTALCVRTRWPTVSPEQLTHASSAFSNAAWVACGIAGVTALLVRGLAESRVHQLALVLVQGASAFVANEPLYIVGPPSLLETPPAFAEVLRAIPTKDGAPRHRVASRVDRLNLPRFDAFEFQDSVALMSRASFTPNTPALWGIESAESYLPAASARLQHLEEDLPETFTTLLPIYGVGYSVYAPEQYQRLATRPGPIVAQDEAFGLELVAHPTALPRVALMRPRCVPDADTALGLLMDPRFPIATEAAVECGALQPPHTEGAVGTVRVERFDPEHIALDVSATTDGVVLINDAWQRGWEAQQDGVPVPILPANIAVRAIPVSAGAHHVVLSYRAPGLRVGLGVSLVTLLSLLMWMGWLRVRPHLRHRVRA
ncbi:YfhO family protein [Corallococcus sp. M34]|uniref:YfhO family protein n=1 Tax=Citreicoccus inhibens TaxID=2849499 RepID=UPI001C22F723|nr:YfhO family protein [Citreicoccus inhibens]MBU8900386.1 YfhO family protein [Citreicoccus inhibens]